MVCDCGEEGSKQKHIITFLRKVDIFVLCTYIQSIYYFSAYAIYLSIYLPTYLPIQMYIFNNLQIIEETEST